MENEQKYSAPQPVKIEDKMKDAYLDYAMSVIVGRALPDARDGLKPVQRRIIYTMFDMGLTPEKPHRKSAKVVGDVMGRFHPHGDSAIYDALVRLAQDFSVRETLVDGHGNFGSVDGDNPAAMRYTEVRLDKISMELVRDIRMDTVDFIDSYDASEQEPSVLPTLVPNLLVNGSAGIAVGMATNIPPHNLAEVIDAVVRVIDEPDTSALELIDIVKGPDFPTAGEILGREGIREAYLTGRGKVIVRGKIDIEEKKNRTSLIITEIPYMVNKSSMIETIADLVRNKKIEGITDIRDESNREGMRVVIELKRDFNPHVVKNSLFKHTQAQTSFGINMVALKDKRPVTLSLRQALDIFIDHRRQVVRRRTEFELKKAKERAHILEGLRIALSHLDEVIDLIKKSPDGPTAKSRLMERFGLSEIQAQAVLDMRLQRLTGLEQDAILKEYEDLIRKISELEEILASERKILQIIKQECEEIKEKYGEARRTRISAAENDIDIEDLIQREDVLIMITRDGWIKRLPVDTYRVQGRGGRGIIGITTKEKDIVKHMFVTSSHDWILFLSSRGQAYRIKAYRIPVASRTAKGTPVVNLLQMTPEEKVAAALPIQEFDETRFILMATREGQVKKTRLKEYDTNRKGGIIAINLREGDELRYAMLTDGERDVVLATKSGMSIRFRESDARPMGRAAAGVIGINLEKGGEVVGAAAVDEDACLLTVCENGFGKRTCLSQYRRQKRGGKGLITIKTSERNGSVVGIAVVNIEQEVLMVSENGIIIRQPIKTISETQGRNTQGVRLMRLGGGDRIVTFEVYVAAEDNGTQAEEAETELEETVAAPAEAETAPVAAPEEEPAAEAEEEAEPQQE